MLQTTERVTIDQETYSRAYELNVLSYLLLGDHACKIENTDHFYTVKRAAEVEISQLSGLLNYRKEK